MDNSGLLLLCMILLGVVAVVVGTNSQKKQKALNEAALAYQEALNALKAEPANVDLRQNALAVGRHYSALAKENKVSLFDEVALMNDLNAIQPITASAPTLGAANVNDIQVRLTKLDELLNLGAISEEEHHERRRAIIEQI